MVQRENFIPLRGQRQRLLDERAIESCGSGTRCQGHRLVRRFQCPQKVRGGTVIALRVYVIRGRKIVPCGRVRGGETAKSLSHLIEALRVAEEEQSLASRRRDATNGRLSGRRAAASLLDGAIR